MKNIEKKSAGRGKRLAQEGISEGERAGSPVKLITGREEGPPSPCLVFMSFPEASDSLCRTLWEAHKADTLHT